MTREMVEVARVVRDVFAGQWPGVGVVCRVLEEQVVVQWMDGPSSESVHRALGEVGGGWVHMERGVSSRNWVMGLVQVMQERGVPPRAEEELLRESVRREGMYSVDEVLDVSLDMQVWGEEGRPSRLASWVEEAEVAVTEMDFPLDLGEARAAAECFERLLSDEGMLDLEFGAIWASSGAWEMARLL